MTPSESTPPDNSKAGRQANASRERSRRAAVQGVIDEWGQDSFPASDPPGSLPPSLIRPQKRTPPSSQDDPGRDSDD